MSEHYLLSASQIFTLFFVMLGPLKMLMPFAKATQSMDAKDLKAISGQAFVLAAIALLCGGFVGKTLLEGWGISVAVLHFASGLIFLGMAFILILCPKKEPASSAKPEPVNASAIAFSMIVTPYGMATVIALLTMSASLERTFLILGLLALVLILDMLAMVYVRHLVTKTGAMILQIAGAVMAVLQAALAMQIVLAALRIIKIEGGL